MVFGKLDVIEKGTRLLLRISNDTYAYMVEERMAIYL